MKNYPAISHSSVMTRFPDVRVLERNTLVSQITWGRNFQIVDIQSAAGYLSDYIRKLYNDAECYCIEPCDDLRNRLNPMHHPIADPVEDFSSLNNNTMDAVLGLAGLHHSNDHRKTIEESYRVLKEGGQIAVCDVFEGHFVARWLNEFVNKHNPAGHKGNFIESQKTLNLFETAGFTGVSEEIHEVPWRFKREEDIAIFFRGLFNLQCTDSELEVGIHQYFDILERNGQIEIPWELLYIKGVKPQQANPG